MFLLNILEAVLAYDLVKIRFMKEKEVILNGNRRTEQNRTLLLALRSIQTYEDMNKYTTLRHGGIYIYM